LKDASGGGGGQTIWGLYITGAVLTAEDVYVYDIIWSTK